jgi:hypothetical protein
VFSLILLALGMRFPNSALFLQKKTTDYSIEGLCSMEPLMQENRVFNPPADFIKSAAISGMDAYNKLCAEANNDYDGFWSRLAKEN